MNLMKALARGEARAPTKAEVLGLDAELQGILKEENVTLVELFKKVAIG